MPYTPVLATLGYVLSHDGRAVLLIRRNRRRDDAHFGKCNGLGGKLDAGEDIVAGMRREIREESGLECDALRLRGTVSWPGFGPRGEDWFGFIFLVTAWHGTLCSDSPEGELFWHPVERVLDLPLWEGDRYFLPLVFDQSQPQFHGVMPYRDGRPVSWTFSV
jgi:8-oxo-dGTP diphosphatase